MGYCYENGVGTAKDMTQAVHWYQKSAARGDHNSVRDCRRRRLRRHVV
ncbi:SEL1-like repeat protein, partial [Neisseria sp. HMSC072B12]